MNQSTEPQDDLGIWYRLLIEKIYWESIGPHYATHLYTITKKAWTAGSQYYVKDPAGGADINLTTLYDQYKMLLSLTAEYK